MIRDMRNMKYEYLTYEASQYGGFSVHGWSTYPDSSVLAGQAMKCFIDTFETEQEVSENYPDADRSHKLIQPQNTFDHLPDDEDY